MLRQFYWRLKQTIEKVYNTAASHCSFYARKQLLLSARLSHRNSVRSSVCPFFRLSVTQVYQSKTVQAKITKFSPSAAWKTLVSGTVKLFYKFDGGHPERGR